MIMEVLMKAKNDQRKREEAEMMNRVERDTANMQVSDKGEGAFGYVFVLIRC